jgi:riboflavin biosynthesis pyrimidine reductase
MPRLGVNFQEVVHSAPAVNADVAKHTVIRAGLIDEFNLIICPAVDGSEGAPSVFDSLDAAADQRAPVTAMALQSSQVMEGGSVLLRYRLQNATPDRLEP